MAKANILVVEDEKNIQELIEYNLSKEGFSVTISGSAEDAIGLIRANLPDLILLDIMLPGMNGLELCKTLRSNTSLNEVPIIMVTAKGEESDIVVGLELGADDYVIKPFSPRVLVARANAAIRRKRRQTAGDAEVMLIEGLSIHPGKHEVSIDGKQIDLTYSEFAVLHFLARKPGWVFTRGQIVDAIRGDNYPVTDRSVDVLIVSLRKKLCDAGANIETIRGIGYRFKEPI